MFLESRPVGPFAMNCYILACETTRQAAIIDAGDEFPWIQKIIAQSALDVRYLLQTHGHIDHVGALCQAKEYWPQASITLHRDELPIYEKATAFGAFFRMRVQQPPPPDQFVSDGDTLHLGDITLQVIATPGHTPGGVCYMIPQNAIFTGDTLFAGSIGRTDLPGGSYPTLVASLKRLRDLPPSLRVFSGHGAESTIGEERASNPFLLSEFGR